MHNLALVHWEDKAYDWAVEFDETVKNLIVAGDHKPLINYERLGTNARLSIPSNEHYRELHPAIRPGGD